MNDVRFVRCVFGEPTVDLAAEIQNSVLDNCEMAGVRVVRGDEEVTREFAPSRVRAALADAGFGFQEAETLPLFESEETPLHKLVRRTLRMFQRTTVVTERSVRQRFSGDFNFVLNEVIPLLVRHGVVEKREWHGSGTEGIWALTCSLDELLAGDDVVPQGPHAAFWSEVNAPG